MSDLIDRQDAINDVCCMMKDCFGISEEEQDAIVTTIKAIPPASIKRTGIQGWICPICGVGISPYVSFCHCNLKWEVTC